MRFNLYCICWILASTCSAHATVYNDRDLFEAAIDVFYVETFESLSGPVTNHGPSLTLPSGLTVSTPPQDGNELHSVPVGWVGPRGPLSNSSTALGNFVANDLTRPGAGLGLNLGGTFEAIGFDFYANFDLSNQNLGTDFEFNIFNSLLVGTPDPGSLIGQFGTSIGTRGAPPVPGAGFFGFINDGNPLDQFDPTRDPVQNGILTLVQQPETPFDEIFIRNFDGSGQFEFIDNVVVGNRRTIDPLTPVPLPGALPLLAGGIGLLGLAGWRRKRKVAATA